MLVPSSKNGLGPGLLGLISLRASLLVRPWPTLDKRRCGAVAQANGVFSSAC